MQIEDVDLHFVAVFSEKKDAIPIIFMHGWPGSFIEFLPMLTLVKEKYSTKDLPYHLIVPSLPGYTLSTVQSTEKEWKLEDTSGVLNQLMLNLGFDKYLAQGGDVGSFTSQQMNRSYDSCVGMHRKSRPYPWVPQFWCASVNMMTGLSQPNENTSMNALEKKSLDRSIKWRATGTAYAQEHSTRPSTIGNVLASNPLALLAW